MKADIRRAALLDRLADHVLEHGLSASSLRPLAKAAGTSDRMLLYYFKDKDDLIGAILEQIAARQTAILTSHMAAHPLPLAQLRARLAALLLDDALWPYARLWLELASIAARGDPVARAIGDRVGHGFLAWGMAQLDSADIDREAAELFVSLEGMVMLKSLGLEDVVRRAI